MSDTPRAFRPLRAVVISIAPMLVDDRYLSMTCKEFVAAAMKAAGGAARPDDLEWWFDELMDEAGVKPRPA